MKRVILKTLQGFGYNLIRYDEWAAVQSRLATNEATQTNAQRDLSAAREAAHADAQRNLSEQSNAQRERANTFEVRLTNCLNDLHRMNLRVERAETRVMALKRRRDRLQAELAGCREHLVARDASGRLRELEQENRHLRQQHGDLEIYLRETRRPGKVSYL